MFRYKLLSSKSLRYGFLAVFSLILCFSPILSVAVARAQTPDDTQKQLKEAIDMYDKGRYLDSLALFQHLDEITPNDPVVKEHIGSGLIALSVTKSDPHERTQIRVRAREYLLAAQALGDNSNLLHTLLDSIPQDGGTGSYSNREDVETAMRAGETAFAKGDLDKAIAAYQEALLLDPNEYEAALFIGDGYFKKKETDQAGAWFARAIAINPDRETAYRYWGDTLAQSRKNTEAIDEYINAIGAEPYTRQSWVGLIQFAQRIRVTLTQPRIVSPNALKAEGNQTNITADSTTLEKKDGTSNWTIYEMSRAGWRGDKFKKEFPEEKEYRHSLKEESDALGLLADAVEKQLKNNNIENLDPSLATLLKLRQEGLVEAYVLISAPDEGIAKDYEAYRTAHREFIHRYIAEYIAAPLNSK